jgi:hypothetical protein
MRAVTIILFLALGGSAGADTIATLPRPADRAPSKGAKEKSWALYTGCILDQPGCLASWQRAANIDPSNIDVRAGLADHYYRQGDKAAALAVMEQLKDAACLECLTVLVKPQLRAWATDDPFAQRVHKGIHGRHTKYSNAATLVIAALAAGDWSKLKPYLPAKGGVGLPPNADTSSRAAIQAWLARVRDGSAIFMSSGLTTCEDDCCYEIWTSMGGDEPAHLMGLCFAPGPMLRQAMFDSLR